MSNTKAATAGGRAAIAAQNAAYQASLKAPPPSGPKIYAFPAAQPISPYAWSKELNDAALQGWKIYTLVKGGISGNQQLMVPARWTEMVGDSIVAQYPASATDWNWVAGVLADRVKNANVGVLGAGFDKVVPYIGLAIFALVAGPMVSQLFTAATGAAAGTAAGTATSTAASSATPAELLATGGGYSVAPVIATPTASTAFITAADSSISFTAANAAVAPGLISSITTTALTGGDIVATSLVNAGVTASSLAVVAPTLASSVAAASFSAASAPSLATALDVLAQPTMSIQVPDASSTAAKQAALNPATSNPSLLTQAQNLLTTMPVDPSTVATAIKTVQQYNQGQAAVRQANAQAAAAQQQAAAQQAALAAQAATANAPASNPLTSLSPGVILATLAAGAALLMS